MVGKISSAVITYILIVEIERPQRSVVYRNVNLGGLGMIHVGLFYHSFFLCPIFKVQTGPESQEILYSASGCPFLFVAFCQPSSEKMLSFL
jgi:hypothetical protein